MEVTGFMILDALKQWDLRKKAAEQAFPLSLYAFEGETKDPLKITNDLTEAEASIVVLQVAQMRYNLSVTIKDDVLGEITLAEAIKLKGATERVRKLWAEIVVPPKKRYETRATPELVRDPGKLRAQPTLKDGKDVEQLALATRKLSRLTAAISRVNNSTREIENLDPELFK